MTTYNEDLAVGLAVGAVEQDLAVELVEVAVGTAIGMEEGLVEECHWVALQRLVTRQRSQDDLHGALERMTRHPRI